MNDLRTFLERMRAAVPEFNSRWSEDLPTLVTGDLGIFLRDRIIEQGAGDAVVQKIFDFILRTFEDNANLDAQNAIQVGIFEPLADSKESVSAALSVLKGPARELFLRTLEWVAPAFVPPRDSH